MRKTVKKILQQIRKNRFGVTLVEMIVVFALLGIFMASASQILLSSSRIYYKMKGIAYARQVSENIMTKVTGMVESAQTGSATTKNQNEEDKVNKKTFVLSDVYQQNGSATDEYQQADFYDRTGSPITITAQNSARKGYLNIHYQAVVSQKGVASGAAFSPDSTKYEATDWYYDPKSYMGFKIKKLTFSRPGKVATGETGSNKEYAANIIKIQLVLENREYGEYTDTQYVECYNFDDVDDETRFKEQGTPYDAGTDS